ncbi:phage portal protein family protein [Microbacterium luteum]|uniref:phage portal protein family protein n=1 Tax=Microbacterium luteum TaxID=2782167 RepID=UPI0018895623|nr:hypothetical protein [Microbacterium luteum]
MPEKGYQVDAKIPGWASMVEETNETNPELMWPKSNILFDRMRSEDSQVGSVLRAVTLPVMRTGWMIDPAGAPREVVEDIARNLNLPIKGEDPVAQPRTRGRFSWTEHLRLALLCLVFGHAFFEQVYEFDEASGRHRLHKLAYRPPRTISKIAVKRDGGLDYIEQGFHGSKLVKLTVDELVVYVNEREGGNWLGRSVLRPAYKNWLLKDRLLRIQALVAERNGLGLPVYTGAPVPDQYDETKIDEWIKTQQEDGLGIARGLRAGETAGASIPHGAKMELLGVAGKLPDTGPMIQYHDEQIARAVLAHFLNLGSETGSWALGTTFAEFFTGSLNAVAQHIADVTQQHVVEDIVDKNWGIEVPAPRIVANAIGAEQPATAEAIRALIEAGAVVPDEKLEAWTRERWGMPVKAQSAAGEVAGMSPAEAARFVAEVSQKVYLAVVNGVLSVEEGRQVLQSAGAMIDPATVPSRGGQQSAPEEAA